MNKTNMKDVNIIQKQMGVRIINNMEELKNFWKNRGKQYLTINQLAEYYPAFSKTRIYEMVKYQGLKHIKGRPILIDRDDFIRFIDEQKEIETNTIEQEYNNRFFNIPKKVDKYV